MVVLRDVWSRPYGAPLTSEDKQPDLASAEELFFGSNNLDPGAPIPDDYVDPALSELGKSGSLGQIVLLLLVSVFALLMLRQYIDEFLYVFSESEPIAIGMADELAQSDLYVDGQLALPSNRYVTVEGAEEHASTSDDTRFFKLIGAPVYVEESVAESGTRLVAGPHGVPRGEESLQPYYDGGGRLIAFSELPSRYTSLIEFYSENYGVFFCGYELSPDLERYLHNREGRVHLALLDELGREPTEAELEEELGGATSCQEAYLVIADATPTNQRFFVVIFGILALIVVASGVRIARIASRLSKKASAS